MTLTTDQLKYLADLTVGARPPDYLSNRARIELAKTLRHLADVSLGIAKIDPPAAMPVKVKLTAQEMERAVVEQVIDDLLAANFEITVNDGEEDVLEKSWDKRLILDAMFTTDEDYLKTYPSGQARWSGWVRLIYGNGGHDVVADHTENLEETLATSRKLADDLANQD